MTSKSGPKASQKHVLGAQSYPKARPETTQKASEVNPEVPRSKEVPEEGPAAQLAVQSIKAQKYCADKIEPHGTQRTQSPQGDTEDTDTFPTQEVLLGAPLLHAPGARMTVVGLIASNHNANK